MRSVIWSMTIAFVVTACEQASDSARASASVLVTPTHFEFLVKGMNTETTISVGALIAVASAAFFVVWVI